MLTAQLRALGFRATVIDANAEALEHLVRSVPEGAGATTAEQRALRGRGRALGQLRSWSGYQHLDRYRTAVRDLTQVLGLVSPKASASPVRVGLANYLDDTLSPLSTGDLRQAAAAPETSPFLPYFRDLAQRIAALAPRLVGLSVNYLHQALPALTLAGLLHEQLPAVPVWMGGGLLSCWRGRIAADALQPFVDRLVFGDGVTPLLAALGPSHAAFDPTPAAPDYSDLPWPLYLSPERIAPVSLSRGCVWGRCNYCPEALAEAQHHPVPPPLARAMVDDVRRSSSAGLLHLTDSTIPPATLAELAQQRWSARWYGFTRFSADLGRPDFCALVRRSGCTMLQLGLESASPRVLRRLRKGINVDHASTALRCLADAGVGVYLYLMFGTPGETREDALATLDFVAAHARCISYLNTSLLNLPLGSPVEEEVSLVPLDRGRHDLSLYTGFAHPEGWDRRAARRFLEREFARVPEISALLRRTPPIFGANHAPFFLARP